MAFIIMMSKGSHVNRYSSPEMLSNAYKLFLNFKMALYTSALVMKPFHSSRMFVLRQNYYYLAQG